MAPGFQPCTAPACACRLRAKRWGYDFDCLALRTLGPLVVQPFGCLAVRLFSPKPQARALNMRISASVVVASGGSAYLRLPNRDGAGVSAVHRPRLRLRLRAKRWGYDFDCLALRTLGPLVVQPFGCSAVRLFSPKPQARALNTRISASVVVVSGGSAYLRLPNRDGAGVSAVHRPRLRLRAKRWGYDFDCLALRTLGPLVVQPFGCSSRSVVQPFGCSAVWLFSPKPQARALNTRISASVVVASGGSAYLRLPNRDGAGVSAVHRPRLRLRLRAKRWGYDFDCLALRTLGPLVVQPFGCLAVRLFSRSVVQPFGCLAQSRRRGR